jgi:hypothetical protein
LVTVKVESTSRASSRSGDRHNGLAESEFIVPEFLRRFVGPRRALESDFRKRPGRSMMFSLW